MEFTMIGPAIALALACLGSAVGCGIAGMASHGIMSRHKENHGKVIAMSALPSSQAIYGFVLMLMMRAALEAGTLSPVTAIGIGASVGLAIMVSAIYQGMCAATGIQASAKEPSIYGKCFAALGIVESFSLFAFVFALVLL
ncbi:MAG: ATP synthase subunit C [Chlamydiota bacterium]|nr:ATP synthase subunit C [Chlamydiota bacterium]